MKASCIFLTGLLKSYHGLGASKSRDEMTLLHIRTFWSIPALLVTVLCASLCICVYDLDASRQVGRFSFVLVSAFLVIYSVMPRWYECLECNFSI